MWLVINNSPNTFSRRPVFGSIRYQVSLFFPEYKMPSLDRHGALATSCGMVYGNLVRPPISPSWYKLPSRGSGKYCGFAEPSVGTLMAGSEKYKRKEFCWCGKKFIAWALCGLPSSIDHRISLVIGSTAVNPPPSVEKTSKVSSSLANSVQF